jgi:hypothetical protein
MSTRASKRMKLQMEEEEKYHESTNDPLIRICSDVHELILQHFSGRDVKELSLVSKNWNETIGSSSKCMSKIQLKIKGNVSEVKSTLLKSQRKYSNILIKDINESKVLDVYKLLEKLKD